MRDPPSLLRFRVRDVAWKFFFFHATPRPRKPRYFTGFYNLLQLFTGFYRQEKYPGWAARVNH
jgi:hypothetical protein